MFALALLLVLFGVLHLRPLARSSFLRSRRDKGAVAMAAMFFFTGSDHFLHPGRYVAMMPPVLPAPLVLVYLSGFFELLGATGLLLRRFRRWAGYGLAALLLAVFPANIYVAVSGSHVAGLVESSWYYWVRLPLQFVFIAWALWSSKWESHSLVKAGGRAR
jgi:uncharacterized membrane protein